MIGEVYSAVNCVGEGMESTQEATRCHFRNVCIQLKGDLGDSVDTKVVHFKEIKPSSVRMIYYRPKEAIETPVYWYASYSTVSVRIQ
jgi:hypothetical protein